MTLDLTKPIRHKASGEPCRLVGVLNRDSFPYVVAFKYVRGPQKGKEYPTTLNESDLENISESRWLNVYDDDDGGAPPRWVMSRKQADWVAGDGRIAIIEDKQDGSPWILHQL